MVEVFRRHRYATDFPVVVHVKKGDRHPAIARDVNEMGIRLEGKMPVAKGETVTIEANSQKFPAVVRWIGNDRLGLTFRPMLNMRQVDLLRRAKTQSKSNGWDPTQLREMR